MSKRRSHQTNSTARRVLTLALFLALMIAPAGAAAQRAVPTDSLKAIVRELAAEAEAIVTAKDVPRGKPDYASRCAHAITPEEAGLAIVQKTHREPFVDAYIRWQLTSFDPTLPEMDDRAFAKFMDAAPKLIENPRADEDVIKFFERADETGKLPPRDLERLRTTVIELDKRTKIAELMNRPAEEYFEFIDEKLGSTSVRPRLWLLSECVATVQAGWSTRSIKTRISKSFAAAGKEVDMPRDDLRLLAEQTAKLAERERRYVNEITIMADGSVSVTFSNARVSDEDVDKWINRLAGIP